jgi:hypothetical protein
MGYDLTMITRTFFQMNITTTPNSFMLVMKKGKKVFYEVIQVSSWGSLLKAGDSNSEQVIAHQRRQ